MKGWHLLIALTVATALSFFQNLPDAPANLLFHAHVGREKELARIQQTIRQYNKASAGVYDTAGVKEELNVMPAAPLLKRALFQDINILRNNGQLMVFDLDSQKVEKVDFITKDFVLAVTREVWGVVVQDYYTRKRLTNVKATEVKARYHLRRENKQWIVHDVEVFPAAADIPEPNFKPAL